MIYVLFQQNSEGTITFKIVPADSKGGIRESKVLASFDLMSTQLFLKLYLSFLS